ncbi:MAG: glycoside hydrolase family 97 protein [Cyclobacteriaceae bacterium]
MRSLSCLFLSCLIALSAFSQSSVSISSPDKAIKFSFRLTKNTPIYDVSYNGKALISDSELGLSFLESGDFKKNLKILRPVFRSGEEVYELVVGKTRMVNDPFREVLIPLQESQRPFRQINLLVRAFNDGLAFRYEFPEQNNWTVYTLTNEYTMFRMNGDPKVLTLFLPNYTTSHEGEYSSLLYNEIIDDTLMDMPTLFEFPGKTYIAITEAALLDYAGMYLSKKDGILTSQLSPLPGQSSMELGQSSVKVKAELPHRTPWRVIMISNRIGTLIESNLLTNLNEPCKIADVSWIKTGKSTFPWWNGNIVPDTSFAPGNNFETNQYYIDFCARNGIEFHSVVEYGQHEWYRSDGIFFQPGPNTDVTKPVPGLDMQQVCDYAKEKGVGIRVWVHWAALYPKLDEAFALFEKWGIKGMMVDFMDRDDQEMVNIQEEILKKAAAHQLHIQFHGAYKPTGLSRTYPNEFTREGTLNYEVNKWGKLTPDHDLDIPFTRMLAGSTDYHLGGFRAVPESEFQVQYIRPMMLGTRCHMLGMYVVLENYQGMLCDYPEAYRGQPGFEFLKKVPTTWDETKVLDAAVSDYIIIARRKDLDWYIGAITNRQPRDLKIPLNFLPDGDYEAEVYRDGDTSVNPNHLIKEKRRVNRLNVLAVNLASGGGAAIHLKRIRE